MPQSFVRVLVLSICMASCLVFASDEVYLTDGRVIVGTVITADGADPVRVRIEEGSIKAVLSYPAEECNP